MTANLQQYLLSTLNVGSLFDRLAIGFVADKIGRFNVFIVVDFLSDIWILTFWLHDSCPVALIAFAVLFGFFSDA